MLARYDFNETFGPLKVYDQGANDTCFYFMRALAAAAKAKIHGQPEPTWSEFAAPPGAWAVRDGAYGWEMTINGAKWWVAESPAPAKTDHEAVKQALLDSGVLMVAVEVPESLKLFDQPKLPVIVVNAGDNHVSAHSLLAVGYTAEGVIVQSSWGKRWGYQGRAILSWEWWDAFTGNAVPPRVNDWPAKDMPSPLPTPTPPAPAPSPTPAPAPAPTPAKGRPPLLLIRRESGSAVFAVTGGVRSWIRSRSVLERQGVTINDVVVLPASDVLFTLPIVGPVPPEK